MEEFTTSTLGNFTAEMLNLIISIKNWLSYCHIVFGALCQPVYSLMFMLSADTCGGLNLLVTFNGRHWSV